MATTLMPELSHRQDYGNRTLINGIAACLLLLVSACTQSVDAVDASKNDPKTQLTPKEGKLREKQQVDETKDETGAKIIREQSSVSKKGTNISVLVNGTPITNYDIQRRASFLKLRRMGGDRKQKATEELVEERLKMQEASKLKTLASEAVVNKAYADFAKRNKMSGKQMGGVLDKAGVTQQHFKEFLKVQISWQRTVSEKFQIKSKNLSQSDALFTLRKSGEAKPETREYTLQQVIFVVPRAKREKLLRLRAAEAKAFSQLFTSCADTLGQVKNLRDVALKELGRVLEPELPQRWKEDVINTEVGKPTRPKETEKGIEFLAVCSVRNVSDDRAVQLVTQSKEFDSFNTKGNKANLEYLKELRSKSTIVYR